MANTGNDYEIINATEFDVAKDILYTKPKVNSQGGKSIGILNSNSKKGLYISTPLMLTWLLPVQKGTLHKMKFAT